MARTQDLVSERDNHVNEILTLLEEEKGITGYFAMQEQRLKDSGARTGSTAAAASADSTQDLAVVIKKLDEEINQKKALLAPVIKELRPLRQKAFDLETGCGQKKAAYDSVAAGLEARLTDLEQEVRRLRDESQSLESRAFQANCDREVLTAFQSLFQKEEALIASAGTSQDPSNQNNSFV